MPGKNSRKKRATNNGNGSNKDSQMLMSYNPGHSQNTSDLQECRWVLNQQIPFITSAGTSATPNVERYTLSSTCNGFNLRAPNATPPEDIQLYGDETGQFNELATLYEFYRLDAIKVVLMPSLMYGTGQVSAILSAVDPGQIRQDELGSVNFYSRARTTMLHQPDKPASRFVNFRTWLAQNVAAPFILTYVEDTSRRQLYQNPNDAVGDDSLPRLPAINMSWEVVNAVSAPVTSFVLLVQASYTFRGRRLKPIESLTLSILKQEELNKKSIAKANKLKTPQIGRMILFN